MKKIIVLMSCFVFITFTALSEVTVEGKSTTHLKFMGIEMNGSSNSFAQKLKKKGLIAKSVSSDDLLMTGKFAGYSRCIFYAKENRAGNISRAMVSLPVYESWADLYNCYNRFKNMLTEKYGDPECDENEGLPSSAINSMIMLMQLKMGGCHFISTYTTSEGWIRLLMNKEGGVDILYVDDINDNSDHSDAIKDI